MEPDHAENGTNGTRTPYTRESNASNESVAGSNGADTRGTSAVDVDDSTSSIVYPGPPFNSPQSQSLAGDLMGVNLNAAAEMLQHVPGGVTPPPSDQANGEDLARVETAVKQDSPPTPTQHYPEYSEWPNEAEETLSNALKRIAQLAKDMHEVNPRKSVEEHYSNFLSKVIKNAEVRFDSSFLQ